MKQIGTVLPTRKSLACDDAYAAREFARKARIAGEQLPEMKEKLVAGEMRYYKTSTLYAIISRSGEVFWFEVREDGTYRRSGESGD